MTDEESVFSRWSRRKRAGADEGQEDVTSAEAGKEALVPGDAEAPIAEPETEEEEAALLTRLGLPRPELLKEGDDFAPFMQAGVPEFLKKRALRVLWRSNPVLANLDGLNDYDEDFNSPELTQKVLATGYEVGRGFLKQVAEVIEGDAPEQAAPEQAAPVDNPPEDHDTNVLDVSAPEVAEAEPEPRMPPRPRRMRFET